MATKITIFLSLTLVLVFAVYAAMNEDIIENPVQVVNNSQSAPTVEREDSRGKMLYENHCHACHDSVIHIRENRRAKNRDDIRYWVNRWSTELQLRWNDQDKEQVATYLEDNFYKF